MSTNPPTTQQKPLVTRFAERYGVDSEKLLHTLKATCFKLGTDRQTGELKQVSNEQMMALLIVAEQYGLNPFTKEIFAFEDKNKGVVPVVSVDGWSRIINEHDDMDGLEFRFSDNVTTPIGGKSCPDWCEVLIYRKNRGRPTIVREYLDEVYVPARNGYSGPWQTHTKRFLRHKTLIQGARIAFGFAGIYDEDEAHRIIDVVATRVTDASSIGELQKRLEAQGAKAIGQTESVNFITAPGDKSSAAEPVPAIDAEFRHVADEAGSAPTTTASEE